MGTERQYAVSTTVLSTTASGTTIASGNTQAGSYVVARTLVRPSILAGHFASASSTWSIHYVLTSMTANYSMRLKLQRRNSAGVVQSESGYGTPRTANGTYDDNLTWAAGTWAADDQLALVWEHYRTGGSGNKSSVMTAGGASYVAAPTLGASVTGGPLAFAAGGSVSWTGAWDATTGGPLLAAGTAAVIVAGASRGPAGGPVAFDATSEASIAGATDEAKGSVLTVDALGDFVVAHVSTGVPVLCDPLSFDAVADFAVPDSLHEVLGSAFGSDAVAAAVVAEPTVEVVAGSVAMDGLGELLVAAGEAGVSTELGFAALGALSVAGAIRTASSQVGMVAAGALTLARPVMATTGGPFSLAAVSGIRVVPPQIAGPPHPPRFARVSRQIVSGR